ncbi:MAG TPA: 3-dehydroquinate synthase [Candidatus Blautia gallistercoris]|uniref:3-dehydroquinate synthase n=1 Tax=Candidatus Blautia gallistercoris TaxID=2838490 RepID=A0A9D1WHB0_9FIRM|nr:3-dehydroquinate synthase [Candidatus Blautia gallistercoris]
MKQQLTVCRANEFSYEIYLREDFSDLSAAVSEAGLENRKVCIVTDSHVGPYYLEQIRQALQTCVSFETVFVMEAGEASKNLDTVQALYEHLIRNHFERKDFLVALGGGVVGDLTGFAAATYLRGVPFIQVPTTLLSQVDSSIGGKTGVDFQQYKNMVGAFHQPRLVYMNLSVLHTLPDTEFACGMGEVLKSGLIWDADYYRWLLENQKDIEARELSCLSKMILRCCDIKRQVVEKDPKEQGLRGILNFGHTIGHAIEKLMDFQLLHGQCVGLGTLAAAYISMKRGMLTSDEFALICEGNRRFHLPERISGLTKEQILAVTKSDKKMEGGRVKFILLKQLGEACIDTTVSDEEICEGIGFLLDGGIKL